MQCACVIFYCFLYYIFPLYLIKGTIFRNKFLNIKSVFWFSVQPLSETFVILKIIKPDSIINVQTSSYNVQCVRKVTVHLDYGTYISLSVSKLPLKCAVVSLYSDFKQRLKCNTGKVGNCLIQFLLTMVRGHHYQNLLYVHSDFPNTLYTFKNEAQSLIFIGEKYEYSRWKYCESICNEAHNRAEIFLEGRSLFCLCFRDLNLGPSIYSLVSLLYRK
jgi:hypothetical protein